MGAVAGFIAGATVSLLFSPDSGEKNRRRLLEMGDDYTGILREKWEDFLAELMAQKDDVGHQAENLTQKAGQTLERMRKEKNQFV